MTDLLDRITTYCAIGAIVAATVAGLVPAAIRYL